ncbi:hypothetical protein [Streptomyces sp. NPDC047315]|uniref:hypothetical protein n=1 Tax=Streptomyces sp. NPDC047315 TaxID=3155142 RepID=UPI0033FD4D4A
MTRYGFAIKALPQGGKPFVEEDDDNDETDEAAGAEGAPFTDGPGDDLPEDPSAAPAASANETTTEEPAAPPTPDAAPEEDGQDPDAAPAPDDSRPWAGDMYSEGDETAPDDAFSAYAGVDGEQAWLDRAPDGTLTGWVRDSTDQVWRYTDPEAWAADVDGAQMTRTHGPEGSDAQTAPKSGSDPGPGDERGVQNSMFASQ